jgi:hypothetical protein
MSFTTTDIREFELKVTLKDGSEQEYEYKRKKGSVSAKVKTRDPQGRKSRQTDEEAISATEKLLSDLAPTADMSREELVNRARSALHMNPETIESLEIEVEFTDGAEIEAAA